MLPLPLTSFQVQVTCWVASGHRRKSLIQGKEPEGRDGPKHKGKERERETAKRTNCRESGEIHVPRWPRTGDLTSWPWTSLFRGNRLGVWTTDSPGANPSARKGSALCPLSPGMEDRAPPHWSSCRSGIRCERTVRCVFKYVEPPSCRMVAAGNGGLRTAERWNGMPS